MNEFLQRVRVFLKAAPTWIVAAATLVTVFSEEIGAVLPAGAAEQVGQVAAVALAWLTAALNIIRRVTPVLPEERGLLSDDQ